MASVAITPTARPPGPKGSLILGNLPDFGRDLLGFFSSCAQKYGDVVSLRLGRWRGLLINHPDDVEQVLVTRNRDFQKHRFFFRHVGAIFGNGLVTSEGDFWLRQRRLAQPAFHRDRIAGYAEVMSSCAEGLTQGWRDGEVRDVRHEMMTVTQQIVAKTLFGAEVGEDAAAVGKAFDLASREIATRIRRPFRIPDAIPTPANRRYRAWVRQLDEVVYKIIRERRQSAREGSDLLSLLLHAQDTDGARMTDAQLRDEAVTLFLAGHETTAIALSWTLYLLSQHPAVDARLHVELRDALGERAPTLDDIPRIAYAERVVKESMRLFPPVYAIGREAVRSGEIRGYAVPEGTTVFMSQWVIHRDARFYEDPLSFRPERWSAEAERRLPKFAYLPFGGGPRLCIGNTFAMMEAVLILCALVRRFRFELTDQPPVPFPSITLRPRNGLRMRVRRR
jgi:cytochrome P450